MLSYSLNAKGNFQFDRVISRGLVGFSEEVEHRFRRKLNTGFGGS